VGPTRSLSDVFRFRPRPSGFLFPPSGKGFHAPATPLCELPVSSKYYHPSTAPACACESTSPTVSSPTTFDRSRRPYHPEIPTSGTVRPQGFSPSRRLASPATLASLFHPAYVLGVPSDPTTRSSLSTWAGCVASDFPLRDLLSPRDDRLVGDLLSCVSSGSPAKEQFGDFIPREGNKAARRLLQSLDHKELGVPSIANRGHQSP
jgi:hypothetical protein